MSDTSRRDERTVCWCQHESVPIPLGLPGARRLARLSAEPSVEARCRLKVVRWCQEHGGKIRLTARHFGFSPDTVSRWVRAYTSEGLRGLESKTRRPKRVRQSQTPVEVVQRIQTLRERYPRWGQEKLRVLCLRRGSPSQPRALTGSSPVSDGEECSERQCSLARHHGGATSGYGVPPTWWLIGLGPWCNWTPSR